MTKSQINRLISRNDKQIAYHLAIIEELKANSRELLEERDKGIVAIQLSVASKDYGVPLHTLHSWKSRGELSTTKQGKFVMCNKEQVKDLAIQRGYYVEQI
jgi:hypothetical protein